MLDLPAWLKVAIPELHCPHCNKSMKRESILSIGIRRSDRRQGKTVLFFEYECYSCNERTIVELNTMSLAEFVASMSEIEFSSSAETARKKRPASKKPSSTKKTSTRSRSRKRRTRSKISQKEIKDVTGWIESCKTIKEFLLGIGLSQEEINAYSLQEKKPKRNDNKKKT